MCWEDIMQSWFDGLKEIIPKQLFHFNSVSALKIVFRTDLKVTWNIIWILMSNITISYVFISIIKGRFVSLKLRCYSLLFLRKKRRFQYQLWTTSHVIRKYVKCSINRMLEGLYRTSVLIYFGGDNIEVLWSSQSNNWIYTLYLFVVASSKYVWNKH